MADLVIKGIKIPDKQTIEMIHTELACVRRNECDRHCENCDLVQDTDKLITAFQEVIRILEAVANAVQLPEGHGDLIDRDNVLLDIDCTGTNKFGMLDEDIRAFLRRYKPIVPAEGGGEDG